VSTIVSSASTSLAGSLAAPLAGVRVPTTAPPTATPVTQADQTDSANTSAKSGTPGQEELKKLVSEMQSKVAQTASDLEFSIDKESGKSIVKVTERASKQVIWQFPSEQALQVTRELDRYLGAFLNRTA
jgi:flagellar protein FlaG